MHRNPQPSPERPSTTRILVPLVGSCVFILMLFWLGGACDLASIDPKQGLTEAVLYKLLLLDQTALQDRILPPLYLHYSWALGIAILAVAAPFVLGWMNDVWEDWFHPLAWAGSFSAFICLMDAVLPLLLPSSMLEGRAFWWRATALGVATAVLTGVGIRLVLGRKHSAGGIFSRPHFQDQLDFSGAATFEDLRKTGLLIKSRSWPNPNCEALTGRVCIGKFFNEGRPTKYWVAPEIGKLQQTLVIAPTGSGKTTSLAIPWSRELPDKGQSVLVLDFKGDMAEQILSPGGQARSTPCWVFNPLSKTSIPWNPFDEPKRGAEDFNEGLDAIAEAIFGDIDSGTFAYFDSLDLRQLKAGVRAVSLTDSPSLKALHDMFLSKEYLEAMLDLIKERTDAGELARIEADLRASTDSQQYSFSERIQGVRNKLDAFAYSEIEWATRPGGDFRLEQLLKKPSCLVFASPMRMGHAGETLAAMAVRLVQYQLHKRYGHKGGRLFLILDEFSKLAMNDKQTERFISVSRSAGAVSVIILQQVGQLKPATRGSIWSNCQDRYILRGADATTAEWLSKSLGERTVWTRSLNLSTSRGLQRHTENEGLSVQEGSRPVLDSRTIMLTGGLDRGAWLQLRSYSHKPILVDLTRPVSTGAVALEAP